MMRAGRLATAMAAVWFMGLGEAPAQWPAYKTPGIPRLEPVPALEDRAGGGLKTAGYFLGAAAGGGGTIMTIVG